MVSILVLIFLFLALMGLVIYLWVKQRRYLKKKTSEAMGDSVWQDIVGEREEALKKRRLFREALERAKKKS